MVYTDAKNLYGSAMSQNLPDDENKFDKSVENRRSFK